MVDKPVTEYLEKKLNDKDDSNSSKPDKRLLLVIDNNEYPLTITKIELVTRKPTADGGYESQAVFTCKYGNQTKVNIKLFYNRDSAEIAATLEYPKVESHELDSYYAIEIDESTPSKPNKLYLKLKQTVVGEIKNAFKQLYNP